MGRKGTIHTFLKSNKFAQLECFCKYMYLYNTVL